MNSNSVVASEPSSSNMKRRRRHHDDGLDPSAIIAEGSKRARREPARLTASTKGELVEASIKTKKKIESLLHSLPRDMMVNHLFSFCDFHSLLSLRACDKTFKADVEHTLRRNTNKKLPLSCEASHGLFVHRKAILQEGWTVEETNQDSVDRYARGIIGEEIRQFNENLNPAEQLYDDLIGTENHYYSSVDTAFTGVALCTHIGLLHRTLKYIRGHIQSPEDPHSVIEAVSPLLFNASSLHHWAIDIFRHNHPLTRRTIIGMMIVTSENQKIRSRCGKERKN